MMSRLAEQFYANFLSKFRRNYTLLLLIFAELEMALLGALGGLAQLTLVIGAVAIVAANYLVWRHRTSVGAALISVIMPLLAQALWQQTHGGLDLGLTNLVVVGMTCELPALGGFAGGMLLNFGLSHTFGLGGGEGPFFWSWVLLLGVFSTVIGSEHRSEMRALSRDQAQAQEKSRQAAQKLMLIERERTGEMEELLERVLGFGSKVWASGKELTALEQREQASDRLALKATEDILSRCQEVVASCLESRETMQLLQSRSLQSAALVLESSESVTQGQSLLASIKGSAELVSDRLRVMLDRNRQVADLVLSIRKTAERVGAVSLNATMEAERSSSARQSFRHVAQEISELGYRLEVSALNVERILSGVEVRVRENLGSVESFLRQLTESALLLGTVRGVLLETHQNLASADSLLLEANGLLRQQEQEIHQLEEKTRETEARQQTGGASRAELKQVLEQLVQALKSVRWAVSQF